MFKLLQIFTVAFFIAVANSQGPPGPEFFWDIWCTRNFVVEPATDSFPLWYDIIPDPIFNTFSPGEAIRVTLRPNLPDFEFTGFLIRAHTQSDMSAVGQWIGIGDAQGMSCTNENFVGDDYASQSVPNMRTFQDLIWTAPSTPGNYVFNLTTVETFMSYWVDQLSPVIRVV
ncbi:CLUMA_CG015198, isoform A [Clunio marinus]|uniref:CLUMA_CG015198, isoform A n=1 Tax=Clunio marinus TaxID=568069 RepID=A0A1J1IP95_9DIPT|nr:CLUMA_CG015198, isoform A [Clunio marinus]